MAIHDSAFLVYTITYIFDKIQINLDKYFIISKISGKKFHKYFI